MKKLVDTKLPDNFSKGIYEEHNFDLAPEHVDKISYTLFTATSNILNASKTKDRPTTFEFSKLDGQFVAGAIVQYFENEDPSKPGNWSLVWTFNEADIPENAKRLSIKSHESHNYFRAIAGDKWGIRFRHPEAIIVLMTYFLQTLFKWLDENAKENEEVGVEQDAVFQARVAVENGQKVFALEPAGEIKMLIKDDAAIEK